MLLNSTFGRTFLFLTNLAWKNRVALPALIMVGCMVLNYRGEIEINIHTERIALRDLPHRPQQRQGGDGGAFGGIQIDDLEGMSDEEYDMDEDMWEDYESDDDNEFFSSYDEEDEDDDDEYDEEDEDDGGELGERMLNGTIRLNWYTTVNIHNARR